jgi:hypothetical protein
MESRSCKYFIQIQKKRFGIASLKRMEKYILTIIKTIGTMKCQFPSNILEKSTANTMLAIAANSM